MTNPKTSPVAESVVEQVARAIHGAHMIEKGPLQAWTWVEASKSFYNNLARAAIAAMPRPIEDETPTDAGEGVKHKPWYETDAHRDLSRIIPDMEGKIAEAETKYAHCLPKHLFSPLNASITELRSLRHEIAHPSPTDTGLVKWPDIGVDPMQGPREEYRGEPAIARLRTAYVTQQAIVPNQTALVWRADLGFALQELTRLYAWQETQRKVKDTPHG